MDREKINEYYGKKKCCPISALSPTPIAIALAHIKAKPDE